MRRLKLTEEEIVNIMKECEAGVTVSDICQTYGMSDSTCRTWKIKYSGMTAGHIRRLRELEDENRRLQQLVADLTFNNETLKAIISKTF